MTTYAKRFLAGISVDALLLFPFVVMANVFSSVLLALLGFIVRLIVVRFDKTSKTVELWLERVPTFLKIVMVVAVVYGLARIAWLAYRVHT